MKTLIANALGLLLFFGCAAEKKSEVADAPATTTTVTAPTATTQQGAADATAPPASNENHEPGTWAGQIKVSEPVSMFNYVGAESGDFAPMRFRNDSEAGKKILAVCSNDDQCEFTGVVDWLDEPPPPDASAIGEIVSVESVRRITSP